MAHWIRGGWVLCLLVFVKKDNLIIWSDRLKSCVLVTQTIAMSNVFTNIHLYTIVFFFYFSMNVYHLLIHYLIQNLIRGFPAVSISLLLHIVMNYASMLSHDETPASFLSAAYRCFFRQYCLLLQCVFVFTSLITWLKNANYFCCSLFQSHKSCYVFFLHTFGQNKLKKCGYLSGHFHCVV